jgi:hypothetical protein
MKAKANLEIKVKGIDQGKHQEVQIISPFHIVLKRRVQMNPGKGRFMTTHINSGTYNKPPELRSDGYKNFVSDFVNCIPRFPSPSLPPSIPPSVELIQERTRK